MDLFGLFLMFSSLLIALRFAYIAAEPNIFNLLVAIAPLVFGFNLLLYSIWS